MPFNQKLTLEQIKLHDRAIELSRAHRKLEWEIISVLNGVERSGLFKRLGVSSLFQYAVNYLGFTEAVAYSFITVSRRAFAVEALKNAIKQQEVSISKVSRLASIINNENAKHWIDFAKSHTSREIDFAVAKFNPKAGGREQAKPISEDRVEINMTISKETYEKLKRAGVLIDQKQDGVVMNRKQDGVVVNQKNIGMVIGHKHNGEVPEQKKKGLAGLAATVEVLVEDYLRRNDPVIKARRALDKPSKSLCSNRASPSQKGRVRIKALERHQVVARDGGRCTFKDITGKRCTNQRWLHLHHIKPVAKGGDNHPKNLTTLCSYHHDMVHQMSLPMDGEVTWLRSPRVAYGFITMNQANTLINGPSTPRKTEIRPD